MNKLKEIFKNKRNLIIIVSALVLICAIIFCLVLVPKNKSNEKELTAKMQEMGKEFYETFYYKQVGTTDENRAAFLKKYETIGIKVNLDNLSRYSGKDSNSILNEFVNNQSKKNCDKYNTQVVIYPQTPYNQKSYKIEVVLDCGFEQEK